ncbi:MAG: hypothetical protein M3325_02815 [Actinomycetota bacterium]|nr:hypothetical protein [Actinomycetota bacterium]
MSCPDVEMRSTSGERVQAVDIGRRRGLSMLACGQSPVFLQACPARTGGGSGSRQLAPSR